MKKLLAATILTPALLLANTGIAAAPDFPTPAPVAYLTDLSTGAVLFSKDADRRMPPASLRGAGALFVNRTPMRRGFASTSR